MLSLEQIIQEWVLPLNLKNTQKISNYYYYYYYVESMGWTWKSEKLKKVIFLWHFLWSLIIWKTKKHTTTLETFYYKRKTRVFMLWHLKISGYRESFWWLLLPKSVILHRKPQWFTQSNQKINKFHNGFFMTHRSSHVDRINTSNVEICCTALKLVLDFDCE